MTRGGPSSTALAAAVFAAALLGGPAVASQGAGSETPRQTATVDFTTQRPAASSGLAIDIDYVNPDDPGAKPPSVREILIRLARGAVIDTTVPAQCGASDQELMAQGESACPTESKVGEGFLSIDTGFPEPFRMLEEDVSFLNNQNQVIFLTRDRASGARLASRAQVDGRELRSSAPTLPGQPPDGAAIDVVHERLGAISSGERHYIATPPRCPRRGYWRQRAYFTYADGASEKVVAHSPCRRRARSR